MQPNDEALMWRKGAEAAHAGKSVHEAVSDAGIGRYDHDERNALIEGWKDMKKFQFMLKLTQGEIAK